MGGGRVLVPLNVVAVAVAMTTFAFSITVAVPIPVLIPFSFLIPLSFLIPISVPIPVFLFFSVALFSVGRLGGSVSFLARSVVGLDVLVFRGRHDGSCLGQQPTLGPGRPAAPTTTGREPTSGRRRWRRRICGRGVVWSDCSSGMELESSASLGG